MKAAKVKLFSKIEHRHEDAGIPLLEMPDLLEIQLSSYRDFLQADLPPDKRKRIGLQDIFESNFPIEDPKGNYALEFVRYTLGKPRYSEEECIERNLTYQVPLKATLRLVVKEPLTKEEYRVLDVREQEVFLGEIPLISPRGTFIINGSERVVVSQLQRSPGIFFDSEKAPSGKMLFSAKIVPYRGSWVEFVQDHHDILHVNIDKRRKLPVTILLRAIGFSTNDELRKALLNREQVDVTHDDLINRIVLEDVILPDTGELLVECGQTLTYEIVESLRTNKIPQIDVVAKESEIGAKLLENTIKKDPTINQEEACKKIFQLIRPGEEPTFEAAQQLLDRMFFNSLRYSLAEVGRYKINKKLKLDIDIDQHVLTKEDFIAVVRYLIKLNQKEGSIDDIDHLGNRRIRSVGELLAGQFNIGLARMSRLIREKMSIQNEDDDIRPNELVNAKTLSSVVQSFFASGQLSQFMDQVNPLTETAHKRRLTALGPGGLTRERAGFEVRDVHHSHYGRICPIETPEGPNIGLISYPAVYARINKYGFLETPYFKVEKGVVTNKIEYLSADEEDDCNIIQSNVELDEDRKIKETFVLIRNRDEFTKAHRNQVHYMDVSPRQMVGVSAALIPFLEHDDANRALMGSNMQRQGVPLLNTSAPVVGTDMEKIVVRDAGSVKRSPRDGVIKEVHSDRIVIEAAEDVQRPLDLGNEDIIYLEKFVRSNQDTCVNQHPIVEIGETVSRGQQISDGPAVDGNELALGKNLLVAFLPWGGYNYEDAIILSERLVKDDELTSIHIQEEEIMVREVKTGQEEITREIPNVSERALRNLDENGIVRVGSLVTAGDVLVGKITPKGSDVDLTPEEKLMKAIFGDKASDFIDNSLKVKPGMEGVVIDVKVFSRDEADREKASSKKMLMEKIKEQHKLRVRRIVTFVEEEVKNHAVGEKAHNFVDLKTGQELIPQGKKIEKRDLAKIKFDKVTLAYDLTEDAEVNQKIYYEVLKRANEAQEEADNRYYKEMERLKHGDELPYGVRKMVKIYIANKRKIQVGDKLAGRHGNKGVVSRVVPMEDMPFLTDGRPVDIILNPLGVPSRMNVGQILETHLGMAATKLGYLARTPVFDGATIDEIKEELREAGYPEDGKIPLYDGRSGDKFDFPVTVGYIYILKLSHLVEDKIHARSTGPYSLVTQQPLGGKAQMGGQRLGEMEVWALEAYGAAHLLQELLTVKSDDVVGRNKTYEAITKGESLPEPGIPESFNVLVNELRSLALDIDLVPEKDDE